MSLTTILGVIGVLALCLWFCFNGANALDDDIRASYAKWRRSLNSLSEKERKKKLEKAKKKGTHPEGLSGRAYYCAGIIPSVLCAGLAFVASFGGGLAIMAAIIAGVFLLVGLLTVFWVGNNRQMKVVMDFTFAPAVLLAVSLAYLGGAAADGWKWLFVGIAIGGAAELLIFLIGFVFFKATKKVADDKDDEDDDDDDYDEPPRRRPSTRVPRRRVPREEPRTRREPRRRRESYDYDDYDDDYDDDSVDEYEAEFVDSDPDD